MDVPGHPETLFITDAAINIFPDLDAKRDIVQNAIDLWVGIGMGTPRVAILSAVETVTTKIPSTIEAAALCKMAERGQITGGLLDGPLAFDNAIDPEAARIKGIDGPVAGHGQILVVPDLEAGNMLAKNLTFLAHADAAGIVLGARVPIVLTSRADWSAPASPPARSRRSTPTRAGRTAAGSGGLNGGDPRRQRRLLEPEVPDLRASTAASSSAGCAARSTASASARACAPPAPTARRSSTGASRRRSCPTCRPPSPSAARLAARASAASSSAPSATASCTAARTSTGRSLIDAAVLGAADRATSRWRRCTSRTTSRRSASRRRSTRTCRRSPASTPPSTAATPRIADCYALPRALYDEGVRRYGFHGLSYEYVAERLREVAPEIAGGRVIVAHLGSGASMCALLGRPQRREHHGLHRARRPADGHPPGPARPRRRAAPDRAEAA